MSLPAYGVLLPKASAKVILDYAGIKANDYIGEDSTVVYNGKTYWPMQSEMYFSPDTSQSTPDGYHIVYAPSDSELLAYAPPVDPLDNFFNKLQGALWPVVLIIGLIVIPPLFRKK